MKNKKYILILLLLVFVMTFISGAPVIADNDFSMSKESVYGQEQLYALNVIVFNNYLYTFNSNTGVNRIEILNISNKTSPELVNTITENNVYGGYLEIDRSRKILFVNTRGKSIKLYDISNPQNITEISSIENEDLNFERSEFSRLKLINNNSVLLVSANSFLRLYDVSDISNISLLGKYEINSPSQGCFSYFDVLNDKYVVSNRISGFCWPFGQGQGQEPGNYIIDISNPNNPVLSINLTQLTRRIVFKDNYGYTYEDHHSGSDHSQWYDEVVFYDFSNINNIQEIDRIKIQKGDNSAISDLGIWNNRYLYYVRGNNLTIFDISNAANPVLLKKEYNLYSGLNLSLPTFPFFTVDSNYIYATLSRNGVVILSYEVSGSLSLPFTNEGRVLTSSQTEKLYLIVNGQKRWLKSPEVFISYGLVSNSQEAVSQAELDQYPTGPAIEKPSLPEGSLIRAEDDFKVYLIKPPYKRHIFSPEIFSIYGHLKWENIQEMKPEIVSSYITSDLYRSIDDYRVYSLEEVDEVQGIAVKHHLNLTAAQFKSKGYSWYQVFIVSPQERDYYQTGSDYNQ